MKTLSKSFTNKPDALLWVAQQKAIMLNRKQFARGVTFGSILQRYRAEVLTQPESLRKGDFHMMFRWSVDFAEVDLAQMTKLWWLETVSSWNVKPASRMRYVYALIAALTAATDGEWENCNVDWQSVKDALVVLKKKNIIAKADQRDRRVSDEEIALLKKAHLEGGGHTPMPDMIDFAILTGLRQGEIAKLTWADIQDKNAAEPMILVRARKNPKRKIDGLVPLLGNALQILKRQPRDISNPRIFRMPNPQSISDAFQRLKKRTKIDGIHFHDLRHEAISRLFEQGFTIPEVALVSGHRDWKSLQIYTNLKPTSLHKGPLLQQQQQMATKRLRAA